ncbi:MAG: PASTA domain-containing protein [Mariniphaga sp.]|nr:PASTA domain-containing protein [Mariniphaga sp.]
MKAKRIAGKPTPSPVLSQRTPLIYIFTCLVFFCFSVQANSQIRLIASLQPELVVVPGYIGMPIERAVSRMPNDRLRQGEITEVYADAPPGIVVGQFPEPEMRVDPGTPVNLEVSLGPPPQRRVEVPNVSGLNIRQARVVLRESGLQTGRITERTSDELDGGIVLEQSPQAGSVVMENAEVDLVISIRDLQVTVPDVRSMKREKAIRTLEESRLTHTLFYESSDQPENTVLSQEPPPGKRVEPGTVVYLTLAEKQIFSSWLFWGGIIVAVFLGGFSGYRLKKSRIRKSQSAAHRLEITFNPMWEPGRQNLIFHGNRLINSSLRFKYIQDSGSSNILKPEK